MEYLFDRIKELIFLSGGSAVIVLGIFRFSGNQFSSWLLKSQQAKLDKQQQDYMHEYDKILKKLQGQIDKYTYISKTRFDVELKIYQELSETLLKMEEKIYWVYPTGLDMGMPEQEDEKWQVLETRCNDAAKTYNIFLSEIRKNAPFINENIYNELMNIVNNCNLQIIQCTMQIRSRGSAGRGSENYKRTNQIKKEIDSLLKNMREYLSKLEIE